MSTNTTRPRRIVQPGFIAAALAVLLTTGGTRVAEAAPPHTTCPNASSGWMLVDVDQWWDNSVLGFEAEGVSVYEADGVTFTEDFDGFVVEAFGSADGASLEEYIRGPQYDAYDKNQDGLLCMQAIPGVGAVSYLFNGSDNRRNVGR